MTDDPVGVPAPPPDDEERRDHVVRELLPWRTTPLTECGRRVSDVATAITREQLVWRVKKLGQQRTAFTICMTCYGTAGHAPAWDTNPAGVLSRDMRRGGHGLVYRDWDRATGTHGPTKVDRLGAELHAVAALIAAHPDEFEERVQAAVQAAMFADRRRLADLQRKAQR
jgi:hypothetical protein